jgi:hypothetical protein
MDRRAGVALACLAVTACGAPAPRAGGAVRVVARGTLGYAVAFAGDRLVTVELGERFELVVRDGDGRAERGRIDLGPPERDWPALACAADRCWVGGDGGEVVAVDLDPPAIVARWPAGEPVTALAHLGEHVAIGDAAGVLCLRRAGDGALLQCVVAHAEPIAALDARDGGLASRAAGGEARGWTAPALAERATSEPAIRISGRRVERKGGDGRWSLVVEMAGAVRQIAASPAGDLAVAAWIGALDHPSVVLVPRDTMRR